MKKLFLRERGQEEEQGEEAARRKQNFSHHPKVALSDVFGLMASLQNPGEL